MEIKDFNQAMALQKELAAKLTANVDKLRAAKAPSIAATVNAQERLVAQAKAELAASEKQKALAVKRLDQQVALRKAAVTRLETGLKDLNKRLAEPFCARYKKSRR